MRHLLASVLALSAACLVIACGARSSGVRTDGVGASDVAITDDGASTGDGATTGAQRGESSSTGADVPTIARACPSSYAEARAMSRCTFGLDTCTYAEGTCGCYAPPQCGGVEMRRPAPGMLLNFKCASSDPRAVDDGGCPVQIPKAGDACAGSAPTCSYGACSWSQTVATCTAGRWAVEQRMSSPPP